MDLIFIYFLCILPILLNGFNLNNRFDCLTENGCYINTNQLNFLLIGDTGGLPGFKTTGEQIEVANSMTNVMFNKDSKFVIDVGDNIYYIGVSYNNDERFYSTFEKPYQYMNIPWYKIAGNHDHLGSVTAQMEYTELSNKWTFPNFYYVVKTIMNDNTKVVFIMLDTMKLCGISFDSFPMQILKYLTKYLREPPPTTEEIEEQLKFLEQKLIENQDADYLFVVGHYSIYSASSHGSDLCMLNVVDPLLHKYKVSAYLSGHDHTLQHIYYNDLHYIVSGAGSRGDRSTKNIHTIPDGGLKFQFPLKRKSFFSLSSPGGFINVNIDRNNAVFYFIKDDGEYLYETVIPRRQLVQ